MKKIIAKGYGISRNICIQKSKKMLWALVLNVMVEV